MKKEDFETMKRRYEQISAPPELEQRILEATVLASRDRRPSLWPVILRTATSAAVVAAMAFFLVCWTNPALAASLQDVPVLGTIVRIASGQSYEQSVQGSKITLKAPSIEVENQPETTRQINGQIETYLGQIRAEYNEIVTEAADGNPHYDVSSDYQVLTNDSRVFSLVLTTSYIAGSGNTERRCYTLDKQTGKLLHLKDLFLPDSDYVAAISAEILSQMRQNMAADDEVSYFIEGEIIDTFERIKADQQFYIDEQGQLVICFDKYEVAPGFMGPQSFVIPTDAIRPLLAENSPIGRQDLTAQAER